MKLNLICALALSFFGCRSNSNTQVFNPQLISIPLECPFNPWVVDVYLDGYYGHAFIAEGIMWSAKHVIINTTEDISADDDFIMIGPAPVSGLEICKEKHKNGDMFFYRCFGEIKYLFCEEAGKHSYDTSNLQPIKPGDSGSPVMCLLHSRVVGIVSRYNIFDNGHTGIITKLSHDDIHNSNDR